MTTAHFDNRVVFVTGGTSGMGLAAAKALARHGAHLAVFSTGRKAAEEALKGIAAARGRDDQRLAWYPLDVADRDQVLDAFGKAAAECGTPDFVINMAGIGGCGAMTEMPFETFDRIMRVNVYGTRHVCEAAIALMKERAGGKLVLAGSLGGFVPIYGYTAYGTSKFAVAGFAQCLRYELKPAGIEVACFCPGEVDTPGLAAERSDTHPAAVAMKKLGGTVSVDFAVRKLLDGMSRNSFLIIPGWRSKTLYWLHRVLPLFLWNAVGDRITSRARHP